MVCHRATESQRKHEKKTFEKDHFRFLLCGSVALWQFLLSQSLLFRFSPTNTTGVPSMKLSAKRLILRSLFAFVCVQLVLLNAAAQNATGSITGVITDPNNAVITGAGVTV